MCKNLYACYSFQLHVYCINTYMITYIHIYTRVCLCVVYMAESGSEVCCVLTPVGHCHGGWRVATPYQAQLVVGALQFLCLLLSYYEYEFFIIW